MSDAILAQKLEQRERPILVEFDPPRNGSLADFLCGAQALRAAGADLITIADCPIGRASVDASMVAAKLWREYSIPAMPHMACRDRNFNATKALLMGLDMEGIRQVLLITGDPVSHEDRGQIKGVFQMTARTLAEAVRQQTAEGRLPTFFLCGALNVNAQNFDVELERAKQKEEAGIRAFLTQPVSSERGIVNIHRAREVLGGYLLGGLFPVVSYRNACFLRREVTGMDISEEMAASFEGLDAAQGEAHGRALCLETAARIHDAVDGYYIMTPLQRTALVAGLIAELRREAAV